MVKHGAFTRSLITVFGYLCLTAGLGGCTDTAKQENSGSKDIVIPIEWTPELNMATLLPEKSAVASQADLFKLLAGRWYASIDIGTDKVDESKTLNNCNDLFAIGESDLHAQRESENNALLEFKVMCVATRLLAEATPAQHSNVPANPLDADLPKKLPKAFALVTSQSELQHIQRNPNLVQWGDVYPVRKVEKISQNRSAYYSDGGVQTLAILGRADINGDNWNDILVTIKDTVEGGSYFNLRLFVLSVTAQGQWKVVAAY
jgi:hypothetical protein